MLSAGRPRAKSFLKDCPQLQEPSLPKVTPILNHQSLGVKKSHTSSLLPFKTPQKSHPHWRAPRGLAEALSQPYCCSFSPSMQPEFPSHPLPIKSVIPNLTPNKQALHKSSSRVCFPWNLNYTWLLLWFWHDLIYYKAFCTFIAWNK